MTAPTPDDAPVELAAMSNKTAVHFGAGNYHVHEVAEGPTSNEESVLLQELLSSGLPAETLAVEITGVEPEHPLFPHLVEVIQLRLDR
jgi:hypothetical protein